MPKNVSVNVEEEIDDEDYLDIARTVIMRLAKRRQFVHRNDVAGYLAGYKVRDKRILHAAFQRLIGEGVIANTGIALPSTQAGTYRVVYKSLIHRTPGTVEDLARYLSKHINRAVFK